MPTVFLNGSYLERDRAMIPIDDRGFVFGDGIYEGVRVIDGRLFEWDAHAARMRSGLAGLRIELSPERVGELAGVARRLIADNGLGRGEAFIYLAVTRGVAARTHAFPPKGTPPTVFVSATRLLRPRDLRQHGARAITFEDMRWSRCDWKTINLLGSVLARQAAVEAGAFEAILLRDGVVTEGAATTVFAVIDGVVRTHPLSHRILPGVTRAVILECVHELGLAVNEKAITEYELRTAEELLLCGTTTDVTPVVTLDGRPVASGLPGPITTTLRDAFEARLYREAAR
ncbi:MAG TPA: aminotransferase class IV [Kofleriaceae bacterium]|nr:aminotransferase class IV [Kofleriaceae bacterium]